MQTPRNKSRSFAILIVSGAVCAGCLGLLNWFLEQHARFNADLYLHSQVGDDCGWLLHNYVVPITSTTMGLCLWLISVLTLMRSDRVSWWYGAPKQSTVALILGLGAGHYVQEILVNRWSGAAIFIHHIMAIIMAFCLQFTQAWRGLLISWCAVYEAGSLQLLLGYIGVLPNAVGHGAAAFTSILGMGIGCYAFAVRKPVKELDVYGWFTIFALVFVGIGRVQIAFTHLFR